MTGNIFKFKKGNKLKIAKYFIFSMFLFVAFMVMAFGPARNASAAISVEVVESNYEGNNSDGANASEKIVAGNGYEVDRWFVQGTGIAKKDVIYFIISYGETDEFDRIAVMEELFTGSDTKDYDTYMVNDIGDAWVNYSGDNASGESGCVVGSTSTCLVGDADDIDADSTKLKANPPEGGSATSYTSLFYIDEVNRKIYYAYTIRERGYGFKHITITTYPTRDGTATTATFTDFYIVVSKPISDFDDESGFTWISDNSTSCGTNTVPTGGVETNDICVTYINGASTNVATTLGITIPQEVAYSHDVSNTTAGTVENNSIYAINTFSNSGSDASVKYYYYKFNWVSYVHSEVIDGETVNTTVANNVAMNDKYYYSLNLKIDASGTYTFYLEDLFGNTFNTAAGTQVEIEDVSIRNLLLDYTNADELTIMDASISLTDDEDSPDSLFGGGIVQLSKGEKVIYAKLQADQTTIVVEVFSKIIITEGLHFCDNSANESVCGSGEGKVEDIRKEAIDDSRIKSTKYWKNTDLEDTSIPETEGSFETVSCETTGGCASYKDGNSFVNKNYNVVGYDNRFEVVVTENGRYRFVVVDINGNSSHNVITDPSAGTQTTSEAHVDVTIIDSTNPELTTGTTSNTNSINSYDYVKGGGNQSSTVDLISDSTNTTIYYNVNGNKLFDYKDAINIAKLDAYDKTSYANYLISYLYATGVYRDDSKSLKSDRNDTTSATTTIDGVSLHEYILKNDASSFTGGIVLPKESSAITSENKFTIGGTTYTIVYTNDRPTSITGGTVSCASASDCRSFTISGASYRISGSRVVNLEVKSAVKDSSHTVTGTATTLTDQTHLLVDKSGSEVTTNTTVDFVNAIAVPAYGNTYMGFIVIEFIDVETGDSICTLGETETTNNSCFVEMNKRIDTVRDFKMKFTVTDYVGHTATMTITVNVVDTTSPGYGYVNGTNIETTTTFKAQGPDDDDSDTAKEWTNVFDNSACMLEIGNEIQNKATLINCYLLGKDTVNDNSATGTYYFMDNDTTYDFINASDKSDPSKKSNVQWYTIADYINYYSSIKLEIQTDVSDVYTEVTASNNSVLSKAGDHILRVTISDNWSKRKASATSNKLVITMTYYVNPRTLLIQPLAHDKVYGEADPVFGFCAYVNKDNTTFSRYLEFFDTAFVNQYFKLAYCYLPEGLLADNQTATITNYLKALLGNDIDNANNSIVLGGKKISEVDITNVANVLLNGNQFKGALSRVESTWYNENIDTYNDIYTTEIEETTNQNDYVGYYNIVLGTLGINDTTGNSSAACVQSGSSYNCSRDYVVKINPNYLVNDTVATSEGGTAAGAKYVTGTIDLGKSQVQNKVLENDHIYTESKVDFTIKQTILTITATGGSKVYGEQDTNSHNWNNETTLVNSISETAYLNGYTVTGFAATGKYSDSITIGDSNGDGIILGVLRRAVGETSGVYMICNLDYDYPSVATGCTALYKDDSYHFTVGNYDTTAGNTYLLKGDGTVYTLGGNGGEAALMVNTNINIYGTVKGKSLNTGHRNYVINYVSNTYTIKANELIVQPGINQGKEYTGSSTQYVDPIWQLVVYGETVTCSDINTCTSNITKNDTGFTGYTEAIATNSNANSVTIEDYKDNSNHQDDTDVYYQRRKTSHDVTYTYETTVVLTSSGGKYTNVYQKSGNFYDLVAVETSTTLNGATEYYVYSHGTYHKITSINSGKVTIQINGHLVNQSYTLFVNSKEEAGSALFGVEATDHEWDLGLRGSFRETGTSVGWYTFNSIDNTTTNFKIANNSNGHCTIAANSITVGGTGTSKCRNYNLTYETSAPDQYKFDDPVDTDKLTQVITEYNTNTDYAPDGKHSCFTAGETAYTKACDSADRYLILFEIFKREVIVSFDANNYIFVYGQRYDYYDGGVSFNDYDGDDDKTGSYHNDSYNTLTTGILNIKNSTSEGDIFVCYNDYHVAVACTNDVSNVLTYDYGPTYGHTWTDIGLEFYMHPTISSNESSYYTTGVDKAIPAGEYYIYADISDLAKENYKLTYLGGTLTIIPKVTSVELTSYTMEYGESKYYSYGTGSDYSDYTEYATRCMTDVSYTTSSNDLINISGCLNTGNSVGNTYGFTVEGLDWNDTIAANFKGRPTREDAKDTWGFTKVGYYNISVGTIATISNISNSLTACDVANETNCVVVTGSHTSNYDIAYTLSKNEGGYLFVTPANINIEVFEDQTKMYGCAYSYYNVTSNYPYTIENGYTNCDITSTDANKDIAYKYTVTGDKGYAAKTTAADKTSYVVDKNNFPEHSSLQGSLYRVDYTTGNITYGTLDNGTFKNGVFSYSKDDVYQGQDVGTYIITLGDLDAKVNDVAKCDEYNNPSVTGTYTCRNYNINYYGNSASTDEDNKDQKYRTTVEVNVSDMKTYDLNYIEYAGYTTGTYYVLINGKYVSSEELTLDTNYYILTSTLTKYKLDRDYVIDNTNGTYVRLYNTNYIDKDGNTITITASKRDTQNATYIKLDDLKKFDATGAAGTEYIKVANKLVKISTLTKYSVTTNKYIACTGADCTGYDYVYINSKYVALNSLVKYAYNSTSNTYTVATDGAYVLVYAATTGADAATKLTETTALTKYKLDVTSSDTMYVANTAGTGAYVFVNGSYILKSSLIYDGSGNVATKLNVNSYHNSSAVKTYGGTEPISNVIFTITDRTVHVHTEYNVKYTGNEDAVETIDCSQIKSSYYLSAYTGRAYCTDDDDKYTLGTARYYAIDNSLAKFPWTSWVDRYNGNNDFTGVDSGKTAYDYNDIQFDVLSGRLYRHYYRNGEIDDTNKDDVVGKYTYDYSNITTKNDLSGHNYLIHIETSTTWDNTYIKLSDGSYKKLSEMARYNTAEASAVQSKNGYYISLDGTTKTSISLAPKYSKSGETYTLIEFWYLGFYAEDGSDGRQGELKKWWTEDGIFANNYNKLILGKNNSNTDLTEGDGYVGIYDPYLENLREVYFEIVRRTIYLYAVDNSKDYGIADKYDNYKVAICATANGYTVDAEGNVSCRDGVAGTDYDDNVYGLSDEHKEKFYNYDNVNSVYTTMKQESIKGGSGYIFVGSDSTGSFMIYFKRSEGENVGIYSVTACATQTGITDCSDPSQEESSGTATQYIGDNYNIIEIAGTLEILTREITVVPDSDQGFMYGNYPNDGYIPPITYEEYYKYVDSSDLGEQGLVNSGSSSIESNVATCLFSISGQQITCINDNQNAAITPTSYVYIQEDAYKEAQYVYIKSNHHSKDDADVTDVVAVIKASSDVTNVTYNNNVYKDTYTSSYTGASGGSEEDSTRYALNRVCGTTTDLRYSREVCNYTIVAGELAEETKWVDALISEDVRIVPSNRYNFASGVYTQADDGTYLKVGSRYYEVDQLDENNKKYRYTYSYVQADNGAYLKVGTVYHKIIEAKRYSDNTCSTRSTSGLYFKVDGSTCVAIADSSRYKLSNVLEQSDDGEFLRIGGKAGSRLGVQAHNPADANNPLSSKIYNYTIKTFIEDVQYTVTSATLTITPQTNQYKIYGDKDVEIKFDVYTTYEVTSVHTVAVSNISSILDADDEEVDVPASGNIVLQPGYKVTLVGYAYAENMTDAALNYGKHFTNTKHGKTEEKLDQTAGTSVKHYDEYTKYNDTINVSRILIGNFYVDANRDQNVGVKDILNGFTVAQNSLRQHGTTKYYNYLLPNTNVNHHDDSKAPTADSVTFRIVPRPMYVAIDAITKTYGQATDSLSCDAAGNCTVESGILSNGETKLIYNYSIVARTKNLPTDSSGVVTYNNTSINLPIDKPTIASAYASIATVTAKTTVEGSEVDYYYTEDGFIEIKNDDLDIWVERGNLNIDRGTTTCLVAGEVYVEGTGKGCEDVGEYYLWFTGINSANKTATLPSEAAEVSDYYYSDYWGYNTNYYVIIENTTDISGDGNTSSDHARSNVQKLGTTLTINKKSIEIVVETFDGANRSHQVTYDNGGTAYTLGEAYMIEENMDVPALPVVSNSENHTTYEYITWALHPHQVRTTDQLYGYAAYCQTAVDEVEGEDIYVTVQKYSACGNANLVYYHTGGDKANNANTGPNVFDTSVAGYYAITRDVDVLYIANSGTMQTSDISGYKNGDYEAWNYTTRFVNGILAVDDDTTAPVIFAGTEYHTIEANNGALTSINDLTENSNYTFLNALMTNSCKDLTLLEDASGNIVYGADCTYDKFTNAIPVKSNVFELNNYDYKIDGTKIIKISSNTEVATISKDGDVYSFTLDGKEYDVQYSGTTPIFITREGGTNGIDEITLITLLQWFNVSSHDPSIVRAGNNIGKRYDARYYIAIDSNFNQRVVADYTLYIYGLDNAGNISRATTVTLRVKDTTDPETGNLNLYEGEISCDFATKNCVTDKSAWVGTDHTKWSNNKQGIWMSVVGGSDNSANYIDITKYLQFTKDGDNYTKVTSGAKYILLGSVVNVNNLTQYYKQGNYYIVTNPLKEYPSGTTIYVRYNGAYKDITSLTRYSLSGSTYTKAANGDYVFIGEFYELPDERYTYDSGEILKSSTGTYIRLHQWEHYFSRDNGATWIKYDTETNSDTGYLALENDGKRLILIKAVDNGVNYTTATGTNTVDNTAGHYFTGTYLKLDGTWVWSSDEVVEGTFTEYSVKTEVNNIAAWASSSYGGGSGDYLDDNDYYIDRKYAYLDTQKPLLSLDKDGLRIHEYCADSDKCKTGYTEEYGATIDSYLLSLSLFKRYTDNTLATESASGMYIKMTSKDANGKDQESALNITGRIYLLDEDVAQNVCTGKWINGGCYTKDSAGTYVYVGEIVSMDELSIDNDITTAIVGEFGGDAFSVIYNDGDGEHSSEDITLAAEVKTSEQVETSTIYHVSGVSGENLMTSTQNANKDIETLDDLHKTVIIYLAVVEPISGRTQTLTGGIFGNQTNVSTTYYRYTITWDNTNKQYTISAVYSPSDKTLLDSTTKTLEGLNLGTFKDTVDGDGNVTEQALTKAINAVLPTSLDGADYKGKNLTFSINYIATDMAGNPSKTRVRPVILTNFLTQIMANVTVTNEDGEEVQAVLYDGYSVDVDQDTNVATLLGNFSLTNTQSGIYSAMRFSYLQTIYYNDQLLIENANYDPNTLSQLDTSLPGTYRIIYNTRHVEDGKYVYGIPLELTVNVKAAVADIDFDKVDYKQIVIISTIIASIMFVAAYLVIVARKRKFN